MQTRAVRLHGKSDLRLEQFELPEIGDDELLVRVVTDSVCMSTHKAAVQGEDHKRVPDDIGVKPVIVGHEFAGDIVKVGKNHTGRFTAGRQFALQPTLNYKGTLWAPGYSFSYYGGACTYCIVPYQALEVGCVLDYKGSYYRASLGEPVSCIVAAFKSNYHTNKKNYEHTSGVKAGGNMLILGGCGPMGLGAVSYALAIKNRPGRIVVAEIDEERIARAKQLISVEEAKEKGVELFYAGIANSSNPAAGLAALTNGHGYDDVFLFAPVKTLAELGSKLLAYDGCFNIFAGPSDPQFKAEMNLYDVHYGAVHIIGASGGITSDMIEALALMETGLVNPSVMVTHIGGLDSYADTVLNLPNIPGGKKLIYTHINMPLTAISDFEEIGKTNPLMAELDKCCKANRGLWNDDAEKLLLASNSAGAVF